MALSALSKEERREAKLPDHGMALRAKHVAEFGDHATRQARGVPEGGQS